MPQGFTEDFTQLTQIAGLITFSGLALASVGMIALAWLRLKKIDAPRGIQLALAGTLGGIAIAFGGLMWLRTTAADIIDEQGIMAALYTPYTPPEGSNGGIMIWHQTAIDFKGSAGYARLASSLKGLKRETYEAFLSANESEQPVARDLGLPFPMLLINEADAERIRDEGAMHELVAAGWTGIHSHSTPGYDAEHNQALVYQATICGPLCGMGQAHLFTRDESGIWMLSATLGLWIS